MDRGDVGLEEWTRPPLTMDVPAPAGPDGPKKLEKVPGFEVEAAVVVAVAPKVVVRKKGKGMRTARGWR